MDFTVEKMDSFQVIGFRREFTGDTSYQEIPKFWDEFFAKHLDPLAAKAGPETELERAICDYNVGEYGACVETGGQRFGYLIAGLYTGGPVPEGLTVYTFPDMEWAKFRCSGPMPGALQTVNTKIFREWLPGNPDYEIALGANIEWYSLEGDASDQDYESAIWVPVRRRQA